MMFSDLPFHVVYLAMLTDVRVLAVLGASLVVTVIALIAARKWGWPLLSTALIAGFVSLTLFFNLLSLVGSGELAPFGAYPLLILPFTVVLFLVGLVMKLLSKRA